MSFLSAETSLFGGKPIELYQFKRGNMQFLFCTSKKPVVFNGQEYLPDYVKRSNIRSTAADGRQSISVTIKAAHQLAASYISGLPAQVTTLTIWRKHVGEDEVGAVWGGRIVSADFGSSDECVLKCEPISTALKRVGLRASYQVLCRHLLYGAKCKAVDNRVTGTVINIDGTVVAVALDGSPDAGYFTGGTLRAGDNAWLIVEHTTAGGQTLYLGSQPLELKNGDAVALSAGCDHTMEGCKRHNNLDNFGGYPFMPQRNPFGNDPII